MLYALINLVNVDEQGKYLGRAGAVLENKSCASAIGNANDARKSSEESSEIRCNSVSLRQTPGIEVSFGQQVLVQPQSSALLDASWSSQAKSSRSIEDQQWDRLFKPRVALVRNRSRNTSSCPLPPDSPLHSPSAPSQPASSLISARLDLPPAPDEISMENEAPNKLQRTFDPRTMQKTNRELVSHTFIVEPSTHMGYALDVISITKCAEIVSNCK